MLSKLLFGLSLSVLIATLVACDGNDNTLPRCEPGITQDCYCNGSLTGTQTCGDDGWFGECDCGGPDSDVTDADVDTPDADPDIDRRDADPDPDPDPDAEEAGPVGCEDYRVTFQAQRISPKTEASFQMFVTQPDGEALDLGTIEHLESETVDFDYGLPIVRALADEQALEFEFSNARITNLTASHSGREYQSWPVLAPYTEDTERRLVRLLSPTECRDDALLEPEVNVEMLIQWEKAVRVEPPEGETTHLWASPISCTVNDIEDYGNIMFDFVSDEPGGPTTQIGPPNGRIGFRRDGNHEVFEDVVVSDEPGTIWITSELGILSTSLAECTIQIRIQYR